MKDAKPHITWCATGPLAFLPLHAAGIYNLEDSSRSLRASDFVVSSYTPSLSALISAQSHRVQSSTRTGSGTEPCVLVVSQPNTPGLDAPLPSTTAEAAVITRQFPNSVTHLESEASTVDAVLNAMKEHTWVHLACHGVQSAAGDPTQSSFMLHDGPLELARLMGTTLPGAELAVLSACQTAQGDARLPEEAVHLAAGMMAVGYGSVVGTMWSIADADGPVLANAFYAALKKNIKRGGGLKAAYALHEAVAILQGKVGEENFKRWVPFVHFGA
jgi:CHAT domain-containing protein